MHVILGAGLSGLSLAVALVRHGVREDIVVVDRRTEFERDVTWCAWADTRTPFLELARHRWHSWEVATAGGVARATSSARPYVAIDSGDFYAAALEELEQASNVDLRLGVQVTEIGDGWARTSAGRLEGTIHDGLAMGSPALRNTEIGMWQTFRGWEVQTERARFDPTVATLREFRVEQEQHGVQFLHVLPSAEDRAVVHHISFARGGTPPHKRQRAVREYVGCDLEILHQERGRLPMTTARLAALRSPRTTAIGVAGGALRPSSGYLFTRVQAHSAALAQAIAAGATPPRRAGLPRRHALDTAFLKMLAQDPHALGEHLLALAERLPADVFARYMSDQSTPADETRVLRALPAGPFARGAARAILSFRPGSAATVSA